MDDKLTAKDAITVLQNLQDWLYCSSMNGGTSIQREAIDIAIGALIQPDNGLQKLSDEIAKFKRTMRSENSDYFTGYMSALSMVEGMIAEMMPHEPCEGVTE